MHNHMRTALCNHLQKIKVINTATAADAITESVIITVEPKEKEKKNIIQFVWYIFQ